MFVLGFLAVRTLVALYLHVSSQRLARTGLHSMTEEVLAHGGTTAKGCASRDMGRAGVAAAVSMSGTRTTASDGKED